MSSKGSDYYDDSYFDLQKKVGERSGRILRKISDKHFFLGSKNLLSLIILTCPVLLFLVSGNKPQLFFSSLLFISLAMIYIKNKKQNFRS